MDKLRVALNWIVAHHFWLLSGLIVLLAVGVWFTAKSDLSKRYTTNMGKIDAAFSKQKSYDQKPFLPNDKVNEGQQQEINKLIEDVKQVWSELYQRQRQEALVWPPQLSERFRTYIATRKFGDTIDQNHRSEYFNYIARRFADLPKMIKANETNANIAGAAPRGDYGGGEGRGGGVRRGAFAGGGGAGQRGPTQELGPDGQPLEETFVVWWAPDDQARIQEELISEQVRSHWKIWTTQEDLWVYETLLEAIAATNKEKNSERYSNAAVRGLYAMEVGKPAAEYSRTPGRIHRQEKAAATSEDGEVTGAPSSEGDFGSEGGPDGERGYGADELGTGQGPLTSAQEKAVMLSRRYIDKEGKPIPVPAEDTPLEPSLLGTGFKQLPVRLDLEMDTRYVNNLIVNMANAPLRIMVTEVRIAPEFLEGGGGGGGRGYGGEGRSYSRGGSGGFGSQQDIRVFNRQPYYKQVILQGVVQIFNEPDPNAIGTPPADGAEDSTTVVSNP